MMIGPGVTAIATLCALAVDPDCAAGDPHAGAGLATGPQAVCPAGGDACEEVVLALASPLGGVLRDRVTAPVSARPEAAQPPVSVLRPQTLRAAPAITWVAEIDALQGVDPIVTTQGVGFALEHIVPEGTALGTAPFTPTGLWEAMILGAHDAAIAGPSRAGALWVGAALWATLATAFVAYALTNRRSRQRGKYRPGSNTRLREREGDLHALGGWAPRVHHVAPRAASDEDAPHPHRSKAGRRRSPSRPRHRRFSYSSME